MTLLIVMLLFIVLLVFFLTGTMDVSWRTPSVSRAQETERCGRGRSTPMGLNTMQNPHDQHYRSVHRR
jgi:hypothetical protein